MQGPFFVGTFNGKPALVDGCGRLLSRDTVETILRAAVEHWDVSGGQIAQQHSEVASAFQRRGGK